MASKPRKRVALVLVDGIGDVSLPVLDNRTPLQAAYTPNLDALAAAGVNGLMDPVEPGLACGSDTAHLSLLGYPPREFYKGRGAFESMGAGIPMSPGDIAFKCNFSTMDDDTGIVLRRRADRQFEEEGPALCRSLDGIAIPGHPGVSISVKYATEHRCGVVIRGQGLSSNIDGTDPLKDERPLGVARPLDGTPEAKRTAEIVNAASDAMRAVLRDHPVNEERRILGKGVANVVLLRGCGIRIEAETFEGRHGFQGAAMVAPTKIIAGLGISLGFDVLHVPEATGDYRTCLSAKAEAIAGALSAPDCGAPPHILMPGDDSPREGRPEGYDFGFLHIKGIDDAGHDKAAALKLRGMEAVDLMMGQLAKRLWEAEKTGQFEFYICVTGDHSTPVLYGDHSFEPVPWTCCKLENLVSTMGGGAVNAVPLERVMFPGEHEASLSKPPLQNPSDFKKYKPTLDDVATYDEVSARNGLLGRFSGEIMMDVVKDFARIVPKSSAG